MTKKKVTETKKAEPKKRYMSLHRYLYKVADDFEKIANDPKFVINMDDWIVSPKTLDSEHVRVPKTAECCVCLGGSALIKGRQVPKGDFWNFVTHERAKPSLVRGLDMDAVIEGLNGLREGDIWSAHELFGLTVPDDLDRPEKRVLGRFRDSFEGVLTKAEQRKLLTRVRRYAAWIQETGQRPKEQSTW